MIGKCGGGDDGWIGKGGGGDDGGDDGWSNNGGGEEHWGRGERRGSANAVWHTARHRAMKMGQDMLKWHQANPKPTGY